MTKVLLNYIFSKIDAKKYRFQKKNRHFCTFKLKYDKSTNLLKMADIFEGGKKLPLIDEFYTLQGEGYHTGSAAYFIRIGGCDIGCKWCDTKISWRADLHKLADVEELVSNAAATASKAIVVTGGEPTSYELNPLCNSIKKHNLKAYLETSGAYPLTGEWDWICLSPKKQQLPQAEFYDIADELKVIISEESDFEHAENQVKLFKNKQHMYLQPEWSVRETMTPQIVDYIKTHPYWKLSVQLHKYLNIP